MALAGFDSCMIATLQRMRAGALTALHLLRGKTLSHISKPTEEMRPMKAATPACGYPSHRSGLYRLMH